MSGMVSRTCVAPGLRCERSSDPGVNWMRVAAAIRCWRSLSGPPRVVFWTRLTSSRLVWCRAAPIRGFEGSPGAVRFGSWHEGPIESPCQFPLGTKWVDSGWFSGKSSRAGKLRGSRRVILSSCPARDNTGCPQWGVWIVARREEPGVEGIAVSGPSFPASAAFDPRANDCDACGIGDATGAL